MNYAIEVQGTQRLIKKIEKICDILQSNEIKEYLAEKMLDIVNKFSNERLDISDNYINHNKIKISSDYIMIYNDAQNDNGYYYSLIVEYGSGMYAEKEHTGSSKSFVNSGYVWWLVPVEEGSSLGKYAFDVIDLPSGSYYKVYGQTPKHIYEDSAKLIERNVSRWVNDFIRKELGGNL